MICRGHAAAQCASLLTELLDGFHGAVERFCKVRQPMAIDTWKSFGFGSGSANERQDLFLVIAPGRRGRSVGLRGTEFRECGGCLIARDGIVSLPTLEIGSDSFRERSHFGARFLHAHGNVFGDRLQAIAEGVLGGLRRAPNIKQFTDGLRHRGAEEPPVPRRCRPSDFRSGSEQRLWSGTTAPIKCLLSATEAAKFKYRFAVNACFGCLTAHVGGNRNSGFNQEHDFIANERVIGESGSDRLNASLRQSADPNRGALAQPIDPLVGAESNHIAHLCGMRPREPTVNRRSEKSHAGQRQDAGSDVVSFRLHCDGVIRPVDE